MIFVKDMRKCPICEKKGIYMVFESSTVWKGDIVCQNETITHMIWNGQDVLIKHETEEIEFHQELVLN